MWFIIFNIKLNELQDGAIFVLKFIFWYGHFMRLLGEGSLYYIKKYNILTCSFRYRDWGRMSCLPFCRAIGALPIGIWFHLNSGKIYKKTATNTSNAPLTTRSAPSYRNGVYDLSPYYLFMSFQETKHSFHRSLALSLLYYPSSKNFSQAI